MEINTLTKQHRQLTGPNNLKQVHQAETLEYQVKSQQHMARFKKYKNSDAETNHEGYGGHSILAIDHYFNLISV